MANSSATLHFSQRRTSSETQSGILVRSAILLILILSQEILSFVFALFVDAVFVQFKQESQNKLNQSDLICR